MLKRIVVAGGGTGGHLFPGMAVVEALRARVADLEVTYVGTERGIEARVLPPLGETLAFLTVSPLKGRSSTELLESVSKLPFAAAAALSLLHRVRPDLVLGVGGYASGPTVSAACALQLPTAVLEQNAHVGLTNRLLSPLVGRAYVSFAGSQDVFPAARVRVTGNPLRRALVTLAQQAYVDPAGFDAHADTLLVLGGSHGAQVLNDCVPSALWAIRGQTDLMFPLGVSDRPRRLRVVHQCGAGAEERVRAAYLAAGIEAEVIPFIDDMTAAYRRAALVVARAGASTVAELTALGRPAILVPYPHAADDHQRQNAAVIEGHGAARCVSNEAVIAGGLVSVLQEILADRSLRHIMGAAARNLGRPEAAALVADDLEAWLADPAPVRPTVFAPENRGLRGERPYVPRSAVRRCSWSPQRRVTAHLHGSC